MRDVHYSFSEYDELGVFGVSFVKIFYAGQGGGMILVYGDIYHTNRSISIRQQVPSSAAGWTVVVKCLHVDVDVDADGDGVEERLAQAVFTPLRFRGHAV